MKDQLTDFFMGRTTTSSKFIEVEAYQIPTMIFCMNPGTKATVAAKRYNLVRFHDVFSYNETFSQVFDDISYILTKEYDISISNQPLTIGDNLRKIDEQDVDFNVEMIRTMHHGTCYKLQSTTILHDSVFYFRLEILLKVKEHLPKELMILLTANDSWHGIFTNEWPTIKPTRVFIDLTIPYTELKLSKIEHRLQKGVESSFECLNNFAKTFNCSRICSYFTFGSLPLCNSGEEFWCNFLQMYSNDKSALMHCLSPQNSIDFDVYTLSPQVYQPEDNSSKVLVGLLYATTEVREELDVITTVQLIGNFGGSMGMFFGFSFAVPLIRALNKVIDKLFHHH